MYPYTDIVCTTTIINKNIIVCPAIIIMIWAIVKSVITTPLGIYDLGLDPMSEVILSNYSHQSTHKFCTQTAPTRVYMDA